MKTGFFQAVTVGVYALGTYLAFRDSSLTQPLTISFICLLPVVIGILTVILQRGRVGLSLEKGGFLPWVSIMILFLVVSLIQYEAIICLLMALPFALGLSSLGGVLTVLFLRWREKRRQGSNNSLLAVALLVILPYISGIMEGRFFHPADSLALVEDSILIAADRDTIWDNMVNVPEIKTDEWNFSYFTLVGLPQPLFAELHDDGIRHATYQQGLELSEPITTWLPGERLVFNVIVDKRSPAPFNMEGEANFDVQQVEFWLEPAGDQIRLHLQTRYRLTTPFNTYGQWWVNFMLSDLQQHILQVIKVRAESDPKT